MHKSLYVRKEGTKIRIGFFDFFLCCVFKVHRILKEGVAEEGERSECEIVRKEKDATKYRIRGNIRLKARRLILKVLSDTV